MMIVFHHSKKLIKKILYYVLQKILEIYQLLVRVQVQIMLKYFYEEVKWMQKLKEIINKLVNYSLILVDLCK